MHFHIRHITQPSLEPKRILLWFQGTFPTTNVSVDSFLLAKRIYPNAEITVRCDIEDYATVKWVREILGNEYRLISDKYVPALIKFDEFDIIWNHDYWFIKKCDRRARAEWEWILENVHETEIMCLYCDPLVLNKIAPVGNRINWENVTVVFNQDIIEDYAPSMFDERFAGASAKPNIAYINMNIYYNLPTEYTPCESYSRVGCYFAHLHEPRLNFFRKVLPTFPNTVKFHVGGRNAEKLKSIPAYTDNDSVVCDQFPHNKIMGMLQNYDWGLYIGRCRRIPWLGMSFYLPLLAGIPVFCYRRAKEAEKVFGGLNCFFSTEDELKQLVLNTNLKELYLQQVERIKSFY